MSGAQGLPEQTKERKIYLHYETEGRKLSVGEVAQPVSAAVIHVFAVLQQRGLSLRTERNSLDKHYIKVFLDTLL